MKSGSVSQSLQLLLSSMPGLYFKPESGLIGEGGAEGGAATAAGSGREERGRGERSGQRGACRGRTHGTCLRGLAMEEPREMWGWLGRWRGWEVMERAWAMAGPWVTERPWDYGRSGDDGGAVAMAGWPADAAGATAPARHGLLLVSMATAHFTVPEPHKAPAVPRWRVTGTRWGQWRGRRGGCAWLPVPPPSPGSVDPSPVPATCGSGCCTLSCASISSLSICSSRDARIWGGGAERVSARAGTSLPPRDPQHPQSQA